MTTSTNINSPSPNVNLLSYRMAEQCKRNNPFTLHSNQYNNKIIDDNNLVKNPKSIAGLYQA